MANRAVAHARAWFDGRVNEPYRYHDEHGPAFEIALRYVEGLTRDLFSDELAVNRVRQLIIRLFFCLSLVAFYAACIRFVGSWEPALLTTLLFCLAPRIFNHSFQNSFDIAFMSCSSICLFTLFTFLRLNTFKSSLLHGAACALATDIRVAGGLFFAITLGVLLLRFIHTRDRKILRNGLFFGVTFGVLMVAMWPVLWHSPVSRLLWVLTGNQHLISERGHANAWHYHIMWIGITVPIGTLILAAAGTLHRCYTLRRLDTMRVLQTLSVLLWLGIPLAIPMIFGNTLYDGWRHHYFVFPPIMLLVGAGLSFVFFLCNTPIRRRLGIGFAAAYLSFAAYKLVDLHPYQNVYANSVVRIWPRDRIVRDYWGLSCVQGVKELLAKTQGEILVTTNVSLRVNRAMFSSGELGRLRLIESWDPGSYKLEYRANLVRGNDDDPNVRTAHSVWSDGFEILRIWYRLPTRIDPE